MPRSIPTSSRATPHILALALPAVFAAGCMLENPTDASSQRQTTAVSTQWGPETPHFNLQVILRDPAGGGAEGHVKFRQPNDADQIIYLDTWVRDLTPNTHYRLQRATDTAVDDNCTGTNWLTLGKGLVPQDLVTDGKGTAREDLFRSVASPPGSEFDIHFRVIEATTSAVVLVSDCYQFTISQ